MGMYVYKVTAETVKLSDGRKANLAVFAYKPYRTWGSDQMNARMHFKSGCVVADHWADKGKRTGLVVNDKTPGSPVWEYTGGSFQDYLFDKPSLDVKVS